MSLWGHIKAETRDSVQVIAYWGSRTIAAVLVLHVLAGAVAALVRDGTLSERAMAFGAVLVYGIGQSLAAGNFVAGFALAHRLTGRALLAPVILVPGGVLVAFGFGSEHVRHATQTLVAEMGRLEASTGLIGKAVETPLLILFFFPFLFLYALISPGCLMATLVLYWVCMMIVLAGTIAGTLLSAPILLVAIYRRFRERARERTETCAGSTFPGGLASTNNPI